MSIDKLPIAPEIVTDLIKGGAKSLFLYGSVARGEQHAGSDIDILEVVDRPREPFAIGMIQVAPYTPERLFQMAGAGSLFIRHIIDEAIPISDQQNTLGRLRAAYRPVPADVHIKELQIASGLLAVKDVYYETFWPGLHACAIFILRSLAYIKARQVGCTSFSMIRVRSTLRDERLDDLLRLRDTSVPLPQLYTAVLRTIEDYQGAPATNPFASVEALTVNAWRFHELTFVWGVRILTKNTARPTYG